MHRVLLMALTSARSVVVSWFVVGLLLVSLVVYPSSSGAIQPDDEVPVGVVGSAGSWVFHTDGIVYFLPPTEHAYLREEVFDLDMFGLRAPIVDASKFGEGAIGVATDGGVFALFGANYHGSIPELGVSTAEPIDALGIVPDVDGYWLAGQDGGVFAFGDATFYGSLPGLGVRPSAHIVDIVPTATGTGYWLLGADGSIYAFGDAQYRGGLPEMGIATTEAVGLVAFENGYRIIEKWGRDTSFGDVPTILVFYQGTEGPMNDVDPTGLGGYWVLEPTGRQIGFGPRDCTGLSVRC